MKIHSARPRQFTIHNSSLNSPQDDKNYFTQTARYTPLVQQN